MKPDLLSIHPVRLIPVLFAVAIAIGTALLCIPIARAGDGGAPLLTALFMATSAVSVTGLASVDTATYWTPFGQGVIALLVQVGGFGIVAAGVLLGVAAGRNFRLRDRLATQAEHGGLSTTDIRSLLKLLFTITLLVEGAAALLLAARLHTAYGEPPGTALWNGAFLAIMGFNHAGLSTYSDSLVSFRGDAVVLLTVMAAVVIGSLGFPVLHEVGRWRPGSNRRSWSLHTRMTLWGTAALLAGGWIAIAASEWFNPATLGPMAWPEKLLNSLFHSAMPRTAGFNTVDVGAFTDETLIYNCVLMFIGGGAAGPTGGVKITTVAVLLLAVWSEIRGRRDVTFRGRRISARLERQALAVVLIAALLITVGTLVILKVTDHPPLAVLFEVTSAFSTVGLSTGITGSLPPTATLTLIVLMFIGRVGTVTFATALALSISRRPVRYPEENPIVG